MLQEKTGATRYLPIQFPSYRKFQESVKNDKVTGMTLENV